MCSLALAQVQARRRHPVRGNLPGTHVRIGTVGAAQPLTKSCFRSQTPGRSRDLVVQISCKMATVVEDVVATETVLTPSEAVSQDPGALQAEPKKKRQWLRRRKPSANGEKSKKPPGTCHSVHPALECVRLEI